ncbi:TIGR03862 family flavoprotein [Marilutibacter spongiae]|uniref:TIGR03862 family flavoprotein n=1 Tax=Marilutibacter spongiae TaxID=2025720 RepID=A0A7W3TJG5_9GAMM|nr:TIGR03862 family flavoprotein [Lysobacter spongiae]MBB1059480.1 TIGR03862 family flavoprotein [Lysobacter spongiae]
MPSSDIHAPSLPGIAVVGGGPAGLMAAEAARAAGIEVDLYEGKGSVGRKFLIAGKGGLNLTHGEARPAFDARYRERAPQVGRWLDDFDADALRAWAGGFGIDTYVGSSGRVFPRDRKAAPLLRAWVRRLREQGVRFHVQHRWTGWDDDGALCFETPEGALRRHARATILALGGASWPQLGSDGAWTDTLREAGLDVRPLEASNCGFDIGWSEHFRERHAGAPIKPVVGAWRDAGGGKHSLQGECVATATGIEGSLVYALSAPLRDAIRRDGSARLWLDLAPGRAAERLASELARPRGKRSRSEHLRRQAGLSGVKAALLHECLPAATLDDPGALAAAIKRLPLELRATRPVAEAISTAGGVALEALDARLMARARPGVFLAGEMLDWEAPTGGYLLQACFASGLRAGRGAVAWLGEG